MNHSSSGGVPQKTKQGQRFLVSTPDISDPTEQMSQNLNAYKHSFISGSHTLTVNSLLG